MRVFLLLLMVGLISMAWGVSSDRPAVINPDPNLPAGNPTDQYFSFDDNFDSYVAGQQLAMQNPTDWTTWSNAPGSGEDPFVSNAFANSTPNSVVIVQNNDLVKMIGPFTSGQYELGFDIYIPSGKAGYFNTLAEFTPPSTFNWGMEVFFNVGGGGVVNAGTASAATFTFAYDTWQSVEVLVDLDNDYAEFRFDGNTIHSWQWTLGANGGGSPLQLAANDFFGATADDEMYFDNYYAEEVIQPVFFDDFEAYTAGQQLAQQNPSEWTTWSNAPGSGEDPFVSNAQAYSGSNSVVIVQNNDLVRLLGNQTSGLWELAWYIYIPSGKAGYFNTLAEFTPPSTFNWGMEVFFNVGGGGVVNAGTASAATFTFAYDTWQLVEVYVDLTNDYAEFYFDGAFVHSWQWTLGANGGGSPLQLAANDFFGATADDEMYFDDYSVTDLTVTSIDPGQKLVPTEFVLEQNYPNPFNPTTTIGYTLKENGLVKLQVYNLLGQLVKTLVNGYQTAGYQSAVWDATDDFGQKVNSGVYIYVLETSQFKDARKMMLVK